MKSANHLILTEDRKVTLIKQVAAVALLIVASKISFSIGPVPLTMQTFAVALIGAVLGSRQGAMAVTAFLALGLAGLPVFATPLCGPAAFFGPTAGYLVIFPFAAALAGFFASKGWTGSHAFKAFLGQFIVNLLIIGFGTLWLCFTLGAEKAWLVGFVPFIAGAFLKSVLGAAVLFSGSLSNKR